MRWGCVSQSLEENKCREGDQRICLRVVVGVCNKISKKSKDGRRTGGAYLLGSGIQGDCILYKRDGGVNNLAEFVLAIQWEGDDKLSDWAGEAYSVARTTRCVSTERTSCMGAHR